MSALSPGRPLHRRRLLRTAALAAVWLAASAHTPYRQWKVYRQKHLLLLAHRGDPDSYELANALAATLLAHLPESKARVTRAPHLHRVASLLATGQLQFAVLKAQDAATMLRGAAPLEAYGAVSLTAVARIGNHLLAARADVPAEHAWLLAEALDGAQARGLPVDLPAEASDAAPWALPAHAGARAYVRGEPLPHAEGRHE